MSPAGSDHAGNKVLHRDVPQGPGECPRCSVPAARVASSVDLESSVRANDAPHAGPIPSSRPPGKQNQWQAVAQSPTETRRAFCGPRGTPVWR